jgi:hypothetical protein
MCAVLHCQRGRIATLAGEFWKSHPCQCQLEVKAKSGKYLVLGAKNQELPVRIAQLAKIGCLSITFILKTV